MNDSNMRSTHPFPAKVCVGCMLNKCYPWNTNPLLICSRMGGMVPALLSDDKTECLSKKTVTLKLWRDHFTEEMQTAKDDEKTRLRSIENPINTNQQRLWYPTIDTQTLSSEKKEVTKNE